MAQLAFKLTPVDRYSLKSFVPHSGVSEAVTVLEHALRKAIGEAGAFCLVVLYGPSGTGKSHLLQGYLNRALAQGVRKEGCHYARCESLMTEDPAVLSAFIARYEECKREGGLIFVEGALSPAGDHRINPHIRSRLCAGSLAKTGFPREGELRPLLNSLAERKNLKLSDSSIQYLIRELPSNPLSLENILAAVDEAAAAEKRKASKGFITQIVRRLVNTR